MKYYNFTRAVTRYYSAVVKAETETQARDLFYEVALSDLEEQSYEDVRVIFEDENDDGMPSLPLITETNDGYQVT